MITLEDASSFYDDLCIKFPEYADIVFPYENRQLAYRNGLSMEMKRDVLKSLQEQINPSFEELLQLNQNRRMNNSSTFPVEGLSTIFDFSSSMYSGGDDSLDAENNKSHEQSVASLDMPNLSKYPELITAADDESVIQKRHVADIGEKGEKTTEIQSREQYFYATMRSRNNQLMDSRLVQRQETSIMNAFGNSDLTRAKLAKRLLAENHLSQLPGSNAVKLVNMYHEETNACKKYATLAKEEALEDLQINSPSYNAYEAWKRRVAVDTMVWLDYEFFRKKNKKSEMEANMSVKIRDKVNSSRAASILESDINAVKEIFLG